MHDVMTCGPHVLPEVVMQDGLNLPIAQKLYVIPVQVVSDEADRSLLMLFQRTKYGAVPSAHGIHGGDSRVVIEYALYALFSRRIETVSAACID